MQRLPWLGAMTGWVLFVLLSSQYALTTPPWNNPDEPAHFNYIQAIARTGELPEMKVGDWDADLLDRLIRTQFTSNEPLDSIRYESWQPPLYYLLAAQVYRLGPANALARLRFLRLFDVALGAATAALAYAASFGLLVRRPISLVATWPRETRSWMAAAVPGVLAGVPMFTAMSGAINNDALAILLGTGLTGLLLAACGVQPSWRWSVGLGVVLGLALLTKLTLAPFAGLVPAVLLVRGRPAPKRGIALAILSLLVALVVLAPWLIRDGTVYGWTDLLAKGRHDAVVLDQPRTGPLSLDYVGWWLATMFRSFWALFGWMNVLVGDWMHTIWLALTLASVAGFGRWVLQNPGALRRPASMDGRVALMALVVLGTLSVAVDHNLTYQQAQGRFLFPAIASIAVLLVIGWCALVPARLRLVVLATFVALLCVMNEVAITRYVLPVWVS